MKVKDFSDSAKVVRTIVMALAHLSPGKIVDMITKKHVGHDDHYSTDYKNYDYWFAGRNEDNKLEKLEIFIEKNSPHILAIVWYPSEPLRDQIISALQKEGFYLESKRTFKDMLSIDLKRPFKSQYK